MWTEFMDMHSGGGTKCYYDKIYIEGTAYEAMQDFVKIFHRDPGNTTCDTCGEDFSISTYASLEDSYYYNSYFFQKNGQVSLDKHYGREKLIGNHIIIYKNQVDMIASMGIENYIKKINVLI